ncbi:MAG: GxxExxY protein, partial [Candidatus Omnitrophota bacterium]|nr:GxxExxY protein [Candidatus Omnitrophota bacterium]
VILTIYKMNTDKKGEYKHKDITGKILKAAFEVHNTLGCGFLEKVYQRALIYELQQEGLKLEIQKAIRIIYKGQDIGVYIADIIAEDKIIIELKVVDYLTVIHKAQALNYLRASGKEVALILNFAKPKLEYKRVVA